MQVNCSKQSYSNILYKCISKCARSWLENLVNKRDTMLHQRAQMMYSCEMSSFCPDRRYIWNKEIPRYQIGYRCPRTGEIELRTRSTVLVTHPLFTHFNCTMQPVGQLGIIMRVHGIDWTDIGPICTLYSAIQLYCKSFSSEVTRITGLQIK